MISFLTWAYLSIIATLVLLSPVLAFLMAIVVEILIGSLMEAGVAALLAFVGVRALGWLLFRKLWVRPRGEAPVET
jgi:hypothetical protein